MGIREIKHFAWFLDAASTSRTESETEKFDYSNDAKSPEKVDFEEKWKITLLGSQVPKTLESSPHRQTAAKMEITNNFLTVCVRQKISIDYH